MKFELAPTEYHKLLSLEDAKLYCFSLNIDGKIGWRLPSVEEFTLVDSPDCLGCWTQGDLDIGYLCITTPVRDLA